MAEDLPTSVSGTGKYAAVRGDMAVSCHLLHSGWRSGRMRRSCEDPGGIRLRLRRRVPIGRYLRLRFRNLSCNLDFDLTGAIDWVEAQNVGGGCEVGVRLEDLPRNRQQEILAFLCGEEAERDGERRGSLRIRTCLAANLWAFGDALQNKVVGLVVNLGLHGMAVETPRTFGKGTLCIADILVPGARNRARVKAQVLAGRRAGARQQWFTRMRFRAFEAEAYKAIGRFLSDEIRETASGRG